MIDLDRVTVEKAAAGDAPAFRKLYDHYAPFVWRIVYRAVGNDRESAAEIVQDTFVKVYGSLKKFSAVSALGTWIYRIAFNASNTFLAKRARLRRTTTPLTDNLPGGFAHTDAFEMRELLEKIMAVLTEEERFILMAREVDGLSFDEIASITGKTSESLRTQMFRLRETIRKNTPSEPLLKEALA